MRRRMLLLVLPLLAAACAREPEPAQVAIPDRIDWPAVDGAERYRVRAYAGHHLLFEEATASNDLELDPSMRQACAAFDSVVVEVRALGTDAPLHSIRIRP